jgi:hypothetical protein
MKGKALFKKCMIPVCITTWLIEHSSVGKAYNWEAFLSSVITAGKVHRTNNTNKKEKKIFLICGEFRRDGVQSNIRGRAS